MGDRFNQRRNVDPFDTGRERPLLLRFANLDITLTLVVGALLVIPAVLFLIIAFVVVIVR